MNDDDVARVARQVLRDLLSAPQLGNFLREAVLTIGLEQRRQQEAGAVRTFFDACRVRGVRVSLSADGRLVCNDPSKLGPDLRAVSICYREAIVAHLEQLRHLEERRRRELGPETIPLKGFVRPT